MEMREIATAPFNSVDKNVWNVICPTVTSIQHNMPGQVRLNLPSCRQKSQECTFNIPNIAILVMGCYPHWYKVRL
jgi:hypothetical protein